jgi:acetylornithine deacetylase/succinyl-diaminopimelate desuccinylase family protein
MNHPIDRDIEQSAVDLLRDLVRIPSYGSESKVVEYLAKRFDRLGISYRIRNIGEAGRENIVATWGDGEPSLLFNSHMDIVSPGEPEQWTHPPYGAEIVGDRIYGRGSADAKGPLAAMIAAMEAMMKSDPNLNGKFILTAVGYEEESGIGTESEVKAGVLADAAVIGEPTELKVHVAHKGVLRLVIRTYGKAAHSSEPWEGINAISKMARIITALDRLAEEISQRIDPLLGPATLAVTQIDGGIGRNIIPPGTRLVLDRRLLPKETPESAQEEIQRALDRLGSEDPEMKLTVELLTLAEAAATPPEERIVRTALQSRTEVLGEESHAEGFGACCDMRFLRNQGQVPTIILGPGSLSQAHKIDEYVYIEEYLKAVAIYRQLAENWFQRA